MRQTASYSCVGTIGWRIAVLAIFIDSTVAAQSDEDNSPQGKRPPFGGDSLVYKGKITPNWLPDGRRFWYRNDLAKGTKEFVLVDAENAQRGTAFDHEKLAAGLSKAVGNKYSADRLPFDAIEFIDADKAIRFTVGKETWKCDLASYECTKTEAKKSRPPKDLSDEIQFSSPSPPLRGRGQGEGAELATSPTPLSSPLWPDGAAISPDDQESLIALQPPPKKGGPVRSPDGKWTASIKDNDVYVRQENDNEVQLTKDGKEGIVYGMLNWSPDSKTLVAFRIEQGDRKEVWKIESSPKDGGRAKLRTQVYPQPGDKFTSYELNIFDVATGKSIKPMVDKIDFGSPRLRWHKDGKHFTYQKKDRGHQRFRVIEVDVLTGQARNIIDEKSETFINTDFGGFYIEYLDRSEEIVFQSDRDGWRHLYLIDAKEGKVKNQVTKGEWVVRGVDRIDEDKRQIWFRASGRNPDQDPYLIHHYRVNFDGTGLVALTEANGNHSIQFSPNRKYIIDSYDRVDLAPVHELRRVEDGKLIMELEKADISALKASGWQAPEVFTAKGRDGKTDIWGIICRPRNLDPAKKYPVIEYIYAGPHSSHVPKRFSEQRRFSALTDLGFIVVQLDGMGTANRSKAFHDVCFKNLKDAGFPDRILWHQAMAKKYPYCDLTRVGIYGTSAGGQSSTGALLFHGDFYKAAVSACGCHDNRLDKASWNEQWMSYPVGPHYAACSNIDNAAKLHGKLLLIVGELDENVPPESTMRLVDALIKANKDFDLLVMPGMGHSDGGRYGQRRLQDFFVRHLMGKEPPDRNGR